MRILLASSEVHPYSKTGGLADMAGALGKALAQAGHQVGVVSPLYAGILERFPKMRRLDWKMVLPLGWGYVSADVWILEGKGTPTYYFIQQPSFYERAGIYEENNISYPDNAERFIFFSKAIAHLARYLPWQPELVHVHDWQTGLVPLFIRHQQLREGWTNPPRTCFTIHNLAYQGTFSRDKYGLTNLPEDYFHPGGIEFFGMMCCLKAGLVYAHRITTVSPRYAREITTPEQGCGMEGILLDRKDALVGILNGADYSEWKTVKNPSLKHSYTMYQMRGKSAEKRDLQKELGLAVAPRVPLFGNIGRLADQKGIDILLGALDDMLPTPMQFVLLGRGNPEYEAAFKELARLHPKQVAVQIGYNDGLPHRIEAGCDFYLMPSRYEPCGLNQLYSMRYGTVPIVRATGGLDDSVVDITEALEKANGIKFSEYSSKSLAKAIRKAQALYHEPHLLAHFRQNAMKADFPWKKTAAQYLEVYQTALNQIE